jgi:serine/threonine protein kinase
MLDKKGRIKLMDFGIAKTTDKSFAEYTQTGTGVQMGTPLYMSPEQITETKSVTAQSDIYSLGVVLWQMVTGQKPYNTNTLSSFQLQTKIVNEPLDNTNSHWDDLIQKATTKDIASRYISANAFKIILESKNDKKVIESDSTIIDNVIKPASEPDPSSKLEEKVNNEKVQVKEEVQLKVPKKNYLPVIIIAAILITALVVYFVVHNQNERKLLEEWRSYRNNREDNGKVFLSKDKWKETIHSGFSIDYREIYEESPDQIIFPFDDDHILTKAINKDCFARWLKEYEQGGQGLEISIWDDRPVYIGLNSKKELIVFYTDGTTQNTVTQETKTWSCH